MNRTFYSYAIFFLVLTAAASLLQSIMYLMLGREVFGLDIFTSWVFGSCYCFADRSVISHQVFS
jgi:hypothetical protein